MALKINKNKKYNKIKNPQKESLKKFSSLEKRKMKPK